VHAPFLEFGDCVGRSETPSCARLSCSVIPTLGLEPSRDPSPRKPFSFALVRVDYCLGHSVYCRNHALLVCGVGFPTSPRHNCVIQVPTDEMSRGPTAQAWPNAREGGIDSHLLDSAYRRGSFLQARCGTPWGWLGRLPLPAAFEGCAGPQGMGSDTDNGLNEDFETDNGRRLGWPVSVNRLVSYSAQHLRRTAPQQPHHGTFIRQVSPAGFTCHTMQLGYLRSTTQPSPCLGGGREPVGQGD
jgi:hypothetical protein